MNGVKITNSPSDFQIIQQKDGFGQIELSGTWRFDKEYALAEVYARVVMEDSGEIVVFWTVCEMDGEKWAASLNVPAGGLYRIETCLRIDNKEDLLWCTRGDFRHFIGIGDVFVIAGQSNSTGYGREAIYDPPELGVHLLRNSGRWAVASHPLGDSTDTAHEVNAEAGNPGHSPYLQFAKMLKKELNYPVGLVQVSKGGSAISAWVKGGKLYENMIHVLGEINNEIKGVLWYQGCSDAHEGLCDAYLDNFKGMVSDLRSDLGNQELYFLTAQLNKHIVSTDTNYSFGKVRDAQRRAANEIKDLYIVPTTDCALSDGIHNNSGSNLIIGKRFAASALGNIYKKRGLCNAPNITEAKLVSENEIMLSFDNIYGGLHFFGAKTIPFAVEDENGAIEIVDFRVARDCLFLSIQREVRGKCVVHGLYETSNPGRAIDLGSRLPLLSFYGFEVKEGNESS